MSGRLATTCTKMDSTLPLGGAALATSAQRTTWFWLDL